MDTQGSPNSDRFSRVGEYTATEVLFNLIPLEQHKRFLEKINAEMDRERMKVKAETEVLLAGLGEEDLTALQFKEQKAAIKNSQRVKKCNFRIFTLSDHLKLFAAWVHSLVCGITTLAALTGTRFGPHCYRILTS